MGNCVAFPERWQVVIECKLIRVTESKRGHFRLPRFFGILANSRATFIGGQAPLAFALPDLVEHIPIKRCCLLLFAGIVFCLVSPRLILERAARFRRVVRESANEL
jgi:hypothetical protein